MNRLNALPCYLLLLLSCVSSTYVNSTCADEIETFEVLAPKEKLSMSASELSKSYVDSNYDFTLNRTIADKIQTIPGVSLIGQGGQFQSYAIRGFSRSRIRTEIDGIPIITDRRAGNSAAFIAPNLVTQASVIKGPSSVLYGSQALGGVVSLSTESESGSQINIGGQLEDNAVNLSFKHQQNDFLSAIAFQRASNSTAPNEDEINSQFERVSGAFRYQSTHDELELTLSWIPSYGHDIGKSNNRYPSTEISFYPKELHSLAQIQIASEKGWLAKLFHHYQDWNSETNRLNQYQSSSEYQGHTLGGQWLAELETLPFDSYLGVDWLSRKGVKINSKTVFDDQNANTASHSSTSQLNGDEDNVAIFSRNQWQFEKMTLALGLRLDRIKQASQQRSTSEENLNASISLKYPIASGFDVSLELASGFRYPTLSERFFNSYTPRGYVQGNNNLTSETSIGSQLNFDWFATDNVNIQAAFYHYDLDNYIERYEVKENFFSYQNLAKASISGFETEISWVVSEHVEHYFSYQQQTGKDSEQQVLADLHPKALRWVMLTHYKDLTLSNSVGYQFKTNNVAPSESSRASAVVWNSSLSYQVNEQQEIGVTINNITNEHYYGSLDKEASLQPQRSFHLSTNWRF